MRVAVLYNDDGKLAAGTEQDARAVAAVHDEVADVVAALRELGDDPVPVAAAADPGAICAALRAARPDVVVNLCESLRGQARLEASVAGLLELLGVPFTGSRSWTLGTCLHKPLAKLVLRGAGVPTPDATVLERPADRLPDLRYPVIVKPSREDASHGISTASVCVDAEAAHAQAEKVLREYRQPVLVEEFIDGREINVSVLGTWPNASVLPMAEIDFAKLPPGAPRLVTYEAKWVEGSSEYRGTPVVDAVLEAPLRDLILSIAYTAYRALDVRGYGRIDVRLCPLRGPRVLEVNPNPDLSRTAGFARAAARDGIEYPQLIREIVYRAYHAEDAP